MERVNIGEIRVIEQGNGTATVFAQLSYLLKSGSMVSDSRPYIQLTFDTATSTWIFYDKKESP